MLETFLQSIKSIFSEPSYWYNLFAILLAIGGLLYGIIKDYVQNKKKEPVYWIRTTHLVRETTKKVEDLSNKLEKLSEKSKDLEDEISPLYNSVADITEKLEHAILFEEEGPDDDK